jgi:hypothetical protein
MEQETIKVNLHGHCLPDYGEWWKKQYGIEGRNLAQVFSDRCFEKGMGIYVLTNDPFWNFPNKSRFQYVFEDAIKLAKKGEYKLETLRKNAFRIEKEGNEVIFLDGQSLRIREKGQEYELLTFGASGIQDFTSLNDAFNYLSDYGLGAVGEHPLAEGHHGPYGKEKLEELCAEGKLLAVEHNAKLSLPNWLSPLPKFRGYTKNKNDQAAEIAEKYQTPVIANDDADTPPQIGAAYTIFPKKRIKIENGETITQDLIALIKEQDFETHKGYIGLFEWARFVVWNLILKESVLKLKERFEGSDYQSSLIES